MKALRKYAKYALVAMVIFYGGVFTGYNIDSDNSSTSSKQSQKSITTSTEKIRVKDLHTEVNIVRKNNGVLPLTRNGLLDKSAQLKCDEMVSQDYWGHQSPTTGQPWYFFKKVGYDYWKAGENLAYGQINAREVVEGWLDSPAHKENMLDPVMADVGYATCESDNFINDGKQQVVVQHLGK